MTNRVEDLHRAALKDFVESHLGLHFPGERQADLLLGAEQASSELGFDCLATFTDWLTSATPTENQLQVLSSHLTVGETYFFRDRKVFDTLQHQIIPAFDAALRAGKQSLRLWSAACCTGEEAYSIAMLLDRCLPEIRQRDIHLLATDVNPQFLDKAARGIYSRWSFRSMPEWCRETYFERIAENRFRISPRIQEMVRFRNLNLATDDYPTRLGGTGAMDAVFCRNVMIYFQPELSRQIISRFHTALVDDGLLVVSPCEMPIVPSTLFSAAGAGANSIFRKRTITQTHRDPTVAERCPDGREFEAVTPENPSARPGTAAMPVRAAQSVSDAPIACARQPEAAASAPSGGPIEAAVDPLSRARALFAQGRFDETAAELEASCADRLNDTEELKREAGELILLVRAYANLGRFPDALRWCERGIAAGNLEADLHYLQAAILLEQGTADEAGDALRRVLFLDPEHVLAHFSLGNLCRRLARYDDSPRHLRNALELLRDRPRDAVLHGFDGITVGRLSAIIEEMIG